MLTNEMPKDMTGEAPACRLCGEPVHDTVVDLGCSPLCNNYLSKEELSAPETFYPLHLRVCRACFLVQLPALATPEDIFSDYRYFSSYASSWLAHCEAYVEDIITQLELGDDAQVVELASNDGYLLQYFKQRGIPCLGVEPAENVAAVAIDKGIPTRTEFFGAAFARELRASDGPADLIIANNVLAHVPDVHDFVEGMRILLSPEGTITVEVPHLLELMEGHQFDTIYHEHFSYFSLQVLQQLFKAHALTIHDVNPWLRMAGRYDCTFSTRTWRLRCRRVCNRSFGERRRPTCETCPPTASLRTASIKRSVHCYAFSFSARMTGPRSLATAHRARRRRCSTFAAFGTTCWRLRWTGARTSKDATSRGCVYPSGSRRPLRKRSRRTS